MLQELKKYPEAITHYREGLQVSAVFNLSSMKSMSFLNIIDDGRGSTGLVKGSTDVPRMRFVERLVAIGRVSTWNPLPIG